MCSEKTKSPPQASSHSPFPPNPWLTQPPPCVTHWNPTSQSDTCISGFTKGGPVYPETTLKTIILSEKTCFCPLVLKLEFGGQITVTKATRSCRRRWKHPGLKEKHLFSEGSLSSLCLSFPTGQTGRPPWFAHGRWLCKIKTLTLNSYALLSGAGNNS